MMALSVGRPWSDAIVRGTCRIVSSDRLSVRVLGRAVAICATDYDAPLYAWPPDEPPPLSQEVSPKGIVGVARILGAVDQSRHRYEHPGTFRFPGAGGGPSAPASLTEEQVARVLSGRESPWWAGPVGYVLDDEVIPIEPPIPVYRAPSTGLWLISRPIVDRRPPSRWQRARRGRETRPTLTVAAEARLESLGREVEGSRG